MNDDGRIVYSCSRIIIILALIVTSMSFYGCADPAVIDPQYTNSLIIESCAIKNKGTCLNIYNGKGFLCEEDLLYFWDPNTLLITNSVHINESVCKNYGGKWHPYTPKTNAITNGAKTDLLTNKDQSIKQGACLMVYPDNQTASCSENLTAEECYLLPLENKVFFENINCKEFFVTASEVINKLLSGTPVMTETVR